MQTKSSNEFISNREWLASATQNENIVLRGVSALEYLQLFVGYCDEVNIDVYAQAVGFYSNIQYHIVDSFDNIDYFRHNNVLCSTPNQAINDILSDPDGDMQALVEALSRYYHTHNESFDGLQVWQNKARFEEMQTWVKNYYGYTTDLIGKEIDCEKRRTVTMIRYQWTEDGITENCTRQEIRLEKPVICYHCGNIIETGSAVKLTTSTDTYIMHTACADKGCLRDRGQGEV